MSQGTAAIAATAAVGEVVFKHDPFVCIAPESLQNTLSPGGVLTDSLQKVPSSGFKSL